MSRVVLSFLVLNVILVFLCGVSFVLHFIVVTVRSQPHDGRVARRTSSIQGAFPLVPACLVDLYLHSFDSPQHCVELSKIYRR